MRPVVLIAAFAAGLAALGCGGPPAPPPPPLPKVTVARPLVQPVTEFTELTGTLAAVKTADVRARVTGYVQKVLFQEGSEVKAGEPLVQIDPEPFTLALEQSKANVTSAEAQRDVAAATEKRAATGFQKGVTSPEEYDQAKAQARVSTAAVTKAAKDVEQAKLNLEYANVKAPFDGRIDRVFVNEGNVVTGGTGQGTVLTRIVSVDPIYAYFTVGEQTVLNYLRRVAREGTLSSKPGGGVPVEIRLRDEPGYPHKGTLDFASSELNPATGTLQIRGSFPNPGPHRLLRPGLYVRGRIPAAVAARATLIPDEAVVTDQAQRVVYVLGPENRIASKPVTLGPQSAGLRVVEGLDPNDRVVIKGLARVQPDMVVDPVEGAITPAADTNTAAGPGGWGAPGTGQPQTGPNGNPEQGAQPGVGGSGTQKTGSRGQPAEAVSPQKPKGP